jgi:hypothetical protein
MAVPSPTSKKEKKKFEDYEIEDAHRTLLRAKEIEQDPMLMKHVFKKNKKKKRDIKCIDDLKKMRAYNNSVEKMEDDEEMEDE